jgi:hypothetical protein
MLRGKVLLQKFPRRFSSTNSSQQKSSGVGKFFLIPLLGVGATFGTAYLREHEMIPSETLTSQLKFLQPIQDFLRVQGFGKDVISSTPPPAPTTEKNEEEEKKDEDPYHYEENEEQSNNQFFEEIEADLDEFEKTAEVHTEVEQTAETADAASVETSSEVEHEKENVEHPSHVLETQESSPSAPVAAPSAAASQPTSPPPIDHFLNTRVATLDNLLEEVARQTLDLKNETEKSLYRDLEQLDEQALRYRILQLSAEFFDRIKWEGLRQQQVLREAESIFAQKYGQLLTEQRVELTISLEKKLLEKEKELLLEHQKKLEELSESHEKRLSESLSKQALQLTNVTKSEVEKNEMALRAQLQEEFTHQVALLRQEHMKSSLQAQESVIEQATHVKNLNDLIATEFGKTTVSAQVHGLSAATLLIETALLSGTPVNREVAALKKHAQGSIASLSLFLLFLLILFLSLSLPLGDDLILSIISTLPKCATTNGIPTLATIRSRFHVVKDEVRKAGLAPENAPPLVGQMIGNALALISIEPSKPIAGEGIEAVLSRTYGFVEDGQLDLALKEVQGIRGYPRILLADWEEMVTNRLIAEQAAEGLRAATALKHAQFL